MRKIPLLKPFMPKGIITKLKETIYSGWIGEGSKVKNLEKKLAKYLGCKYVVCTNSGTSALWIACKLIDLKKGDIIISTPMTCSATNIPFLHFGAKIVWADIDLKTGNISPESIKKKINRKTKALCIVDYGGKPCEMDKIRSLARKYKIKVIEDAAQALGARYKSIKLGNHNEYVCFSLQSVKTITSVDGGFLCLKSKKDYNRAKKLRWFGIDREKKLKKVDNWIYDIKDAGYKMHMNDVLATIGIEQLNHIDKIINKQRANAKYYNEKLKNMKEIITMEDFKHYFNTYWLYILLVRDRKKFMNILKKRGIDVSPIHQRNDKLSIFGKLDKRLKNLKYFDEHSVCMPNGYWVSKRDREYIVKVIKENFE